MSYTADDAHAKVVIVRITSLVTFLLIMPILS